MYAYKCIYTHSFTYEIMYMFPAYYNVPRIHSNVLTIAEVYTNKL